MTRPDDLAPLRMFAVSLVWDLTRIVALLGGGALVGMMVAIWRAM